MLVQQANALEGDIATAKKAVDDFFVDGDGAEFTDESDLQSVTDLATSKGPAEGHQQAVSTAKGMVDDFFTLAQARLSMMKPKWIKLLLTCVS